MKKTSVKIGLTVVALTSILAACDRNRPADTTANNRHMKLKVDSPRKINPEAIYQNRDEKLKGKDSSRVIVVKSSNSTKILKSLIETSANKVGEEAEVQDNRIKITYLGCDNTVCMADVKLPLENDDLEGFVGTIKSLSDEEIVVQRSYEKELPIDLSVNADSVITQREQTITIKVEGLDGKKMVDAKNDDGFNRITAELVEKQNCVLIPDENSNKTKHAEEVIAKAMDCQDSRALIVSESVPAENNDQEFAVASEFVGTIFAENKDTKTVLDSEVSARVISAAKKSMDAATEEAKKKKSTVAPTISVKVFKSAGSTEAEVVAVPALSSVSLSLGDIRSIEAAIQN